MKSLGEILGRINEPTFIGEPYECECGHMVQLIEIPVIGGPNKGKLMQQKKGCKCEDKQLAAEAIEARRRADVKRAKEFFDANSLLNDDLKKASFETFNPAKSAAASMGKQKAVQFVQRFNPKEPENLIFYGPPQQGKSHLSVSITKALLDKGYSSVFISVPKLLTKIKSTYNKNSTVTEEDLLQHLKTVDLLVIDDLGAEKSASQTDKSWSDSLLWQIIDDRQGKHTIFTSNLTDAGLQEFYEERTYMRLMKRTEKIVMKG